uniref:ERCC1-like central domain-containing protein n=1 Tax=Parascaris equorum TaxID=6256 RepID=A0A914SAT3_PAREQ
LRCYESIQGQTTSASSKLAINRRRQEGNPVLKYIRNVPFEWADIKVVFSIDFIEKTPHLILQLSEVTNFQADFEAGKEMDGADYIIKVLLVLVNVDQRFMLRELNLFCYRTGWTLVLCYSPEEAAEYLENFHMAKNKNEQTAVTAMQAKKKKRQGISETNESCQQIQRAVDLLCGIRSISTSDAQRLIGTFGSIAAIANADIERLSLCPGLGPVKAENIFTFFRIPFIKT